MAAAPENHPEFLMFYNVENLFVADDPLKNPGTFSGLNRWTPKRYQRKLEKIAQVFDLVRLEKGRMPLFVGISEVQGRQPLEDLMKMQPFNSTFGIVHYESMDERGVDVALLYDKAKVEVISSEPISFFFENDPENRAYYDTTRDVLHCRLRIRGEVLNVFVLHLPSKREGDVNRPKRNFIISEIRERIINLNAERHEAVVLCGDFNENPDDDSLQTLLLDDAGTALLQNPFLPLYRGQVYSTFHYSSGLLFDQIYLSKEFFSGNFPFSFVEAEVFRPEALGSPDRKFRGRPFRTYAGTRYLGGFSDHFPVLVQLSAPGE